MLSRQLVAYTIILEVPLQLQNTDESEEENILPADNAFSNTQRVRERSSNAATSVRQNFLNYFNYLHN